MEREGVKHATEDGEAVAVGSELAVKGKKDEEKAPAQTAEDDAVVVPYLPLEMVCEIFKQMHVVDLVRARSVCRLWSVTIGPHKSCASPPGWGSSWSCPEVSKANRLWRHAYFNTWPRLPPLSSSQPTPQVAAVSAEPKETEEAVKDWCVLALDRLEMQLIAARRKRLADALEAGALPQHAPRYSEDDLELVRNESKLRAHVESHLADLANSEDEDKRKAAQVFSRLYQNGVYFRHISPVEKPKASEANAHVYEVEIILYSPMTGLPTALLINHQRGKSKSGSLPVTREVGMAEMRLKLCGSAPVSDEAINAFIRVFSVWK